MAVIPCYEIYQLNKTQKMNLTIKHPEHGEITVHSKLPQEIMETIGDVAPDFGKYEKFFYAYINKNENETFSIVELCVVKRESFNVGWMDNLKGSKNFVTLIVNRLIGKEELVVYPSAIVSIQNDK